MKVVVIGGSGLIGSKVVSNLRAAGHEAIAASPQSGVNTVTGEGLDAVLAGARVVVDVSNAPSWADADVLAFFETSTRNLLAAEAKAGVAHHVALSVVGADRVPDSGYLRAKAAQEKLIESGGVPWSIVRATQFFEFLGRVADSAVHDGTIHLTPAKVQPIAATDVAAEVTQAAVGEPTLSITEVAGPERIGMNEIVGRYLSSIGDTRKVVVDPEERYFGAKLDDRSLTPDEGAHIGAIGFEEWMRDQPHAH
ncbi:MAG: SDR family oxidoreductase [Kofleriaceae bacterium]|nr:SDR family oxidoreductase [Kofleriaceae bacterium]